MPHFSVGTILLLVLVALILFGPSRLPEVGRAFGRTLREFKNGSKELLSEGEPAAAADSAKPDGDAKRSKDEP